MNKRQTRVGTPFWMAPEVIMESFYDGCADIWSTGITAIELATGSPPLAKNMAPLQAILQIPKRNPPRLEDYELETSTSSSTSEGKDDKEDDGENINDTTTINANTTSGSSHIIASNSKSSNGRIIFSDSFKEFVARCLQKNPMDRPSAKEALELEFLMSAPDDMPEELTESIKRCRDVRYNNIANQTNQYLVQKSSKTNITNNKSKKKSSNKSKSKTKTKTKTNVDSDGNAITLTEEYGNGNGNVVIHDTNNVDMSEKEEKKKLKKGRIKKKRSNVNEDNDHGTDGRNHYDTNVNDVNINDVHNNNCNNDDPKNIETPHIDKDKEEATYDAKINDNATFNDDDDKNVLAIDTNTTGTASITTSDDRSKNKDNENKNEDESNKDNNKNEEPGIEVTESKKKERVKKKKIKKQSSKGSSGSSDKSKLKSSKNRNRSRSDIKDHNESDMNNTPGSSPMASRGKKHSTKDSLSDDNFSFSSASNRRYTHSQASLGDDSSIFDHSIDESHDYHRRFGEMSNSHSQSSLTLQGTTTPKDYYNNYYDNNNYYFPNDGVSGMNDADAGGADGQDRETFFDWNFDDSNSKDMSGLMSDYLRFQGMDGREEAAFARRLASDLRRNRSRSEDIDTEDTLSSDSSSASSDSGTGTGNSSYTGSLNRTPWDNRDHNNNSGFGLGSLRLMRKCGVASETESIIFKNVVQPSLAALVEAATNITSSNHPSSDNLLNDQDLQHRQHTSIGRLCETLMNTLHELDVRSNGSLTMELVTNISSFMMEEMDGIPNS